MASCHPNAAEAVASVTIICTLPDSRKHNEGNIQIKPQRYRDVSVMVFALWLQENF